MNTIVPLSAPAWKNQYIVGHWRSAPQRSEVGTVGMGRQTDAGKGADMRELLRAVGARRDIDAYETLFRHFAPRVKAYMARMGGDSQLAEELMQETMIAVWNKADRFDPSKGAASTWIFTIARNLRIDAFRRERRPDFDPDDPAFVPDDMAPADAELDAREASEQLHEAIAALPAEQAALLKLSFFEDQSHSAIAARLNLPLGTVKSRMRLAFDKLRAALARSGDVS
ncbi:sigma-70 family RNA polymerase sigma factor [Mycoplana ramosa]|uniref:Sigma-70 family RNA polymerase sigma factor n=2 Tax=Mycoplana ramosa TaxID=40837 RepID=A0ABW3YYK9_MYCRA